MTGGGDDEGDGDTGVIVRMMTITYAPFNPSNAYYRFHHCGSFEMRGKKDYLRVNTK